MANRKGSIPQSSLRRAGHLFAAGARVAVREVGMRAATALGASDNPLAVRIRQTQELVDALSRLKGAAMKGGQLLSIELSDVLPPEIVKVLRQLHDDGATMPLDQVRWILRRELGVDKASALENLSPEPIASASIGQVHRAEIDGRPVAVKVQFPGIAASIDSDLATVRRLTDAYIRIQGKQMDIGPLFDELAEGVKVEADYLSEARNLQQYAATIVHPGLIVPRLEVGFSTAKVIVMSFEEGMRINDWLRAKPDAAAKDHFASLVFDLMVAEIVRTGLMQSDPNYGNFLYRPDEGRLVLLDFGSTVSFPEAARVQFIAMLDAALAGDEDRILRQAYEFGYIDRRESPEVQEKFRAAFRAVIAIFDPARQPFHFGDPATLKELRTTFFAFGMGVRYSAPANNLAFLGRKLSGMFHLLKDLDAVVDLRGLLDRIKRDGRGLNTDFTTY